MICEKRTCHQITVVNESRCELFEPGCIYYLDDLCDQHCPLLLHAIFPYRLTIEMGGAFRWVTGDRGVIAQCCSAVPAVETSTQLVEGQIKTSVCGTKGRCPHGYEIGQAVGLSDRKCLKLVAEILPLALNGNCKNLEISCSGCKSGRIMVRIDV